MSKLNIRHSIGRLAQFGLVIDGTLHLAEVASAYYEEAWTTLMLTSLHSTIFFLSAYFIGHDLSHHNEGDINV
jgi:hypothetical protein